VTAEEREPRYTFGDDPTAGRRLGLVAAVFADATEAFVASSGPVHGGTALDLGCGPGHSTALLAAASGAAEVVGLDRSPAFVAAARRTYPSVCFRCHDVTQPLPAPAPTLVLARLLLAHLADPAARARSWAAQLAPGGRLLLEEMEWIDTRDPVLADYEECVLAVVAHQGAPMYAGPLLAPVGVDDGLRRVSSDLRAIEVPVPVAARIYGLNLGRWRHDPYAEATFAAAELDDLAARLEQLALDGQGSVGWGVRHVVLERGA
jgi:SAM-dependent methyltransferase